MQVPLLAATNVYNNLIALRRARSAQRLDLVRLQKLTDLNRMRQDKAASSEETAKLEVEIADLKNDIDELWALGGRDLDAERVEQLFGRQGKGQRDGG